ncbi:MAG: AAA family ATPase [Erysipelotrichaceae bacterium]|nr:AAA family ATPase [Erysipelotrichaceae bacterium]
MSKDDRRRDEKERLWNEVLNKPRTYESTDASQEIELTINANEKVKEKAENTKETLKRADLAMDELNKILKKQQKDLENLSNEMKKRENETIDPSLMDLDQLEKDIRRDYGVEEMKSYRKEIKEIEPSVFEDIYNVIISKIMGQKDAMKLLVNAFRRPYVMGEVTGKPRNVILISGPEGSGRHEAVTQMARSLYEKGVFISDEVYTIDMSRYTSGSQETIFLQDLYQALQGKGSVICFEHFENGFPAFLRMIDSLVTDGKVVLNKRYVLSKGVLVENQTGLVTSSVDSLSAEGKYLIFITTQKPSKVQDAFGADFMYHVLDTVILKPLDEESVKAIIAQQADALTKKAKENLKTDIEFPQELQEWVAVHYDKTQGADSISAIFYDFYVSLAELVLHSDHKETDQISLSVRDDVPYALCHGQEVRLSRSKNSQEEIDAVNAELDEIVGLDMVKDYIRSLQAHIAMQQKRREQGMKTAEVSKHMIFTGNPGTGKTTIARLISRYMKAIGALSQGQLVEVTRADLVAQYVGQTAPLTMSVIKSALGGVLFIDEAYSLYRGKDDSFGLECIDTLVKAMEDHRDDLIVILAGYKKEMAGFLESNSGLKSRFPNLINFPDYTGEELRKIAALQAKGKGYVIDEAVFDRLESYFNEVQSINAAEAGNGRLARNVVEDAILRQSERVVKDPEADMSLLKEEDFDFTVKVKPAAKKDDTTLEDLMKLMNQQ